MTLSESVIGTATGNNVPLSPPNSNYSNSPTISTENTSGKTYSGPSSPHPLFHQAGNSPTSPIFVSKKKSLYKTEMCRSAEETGNCPYGSKCQFAHSASELRVLERHPRYKTEMCKTFWEHGTCPYGRRCCFRHSKEAEEAETEKPSGNAKGPAISANIRKSNSHRLSPILAKLEINQMQVRTNTSTLEQQNGRHSNVNHLSRSPSLNLNDYPGQDISRNNQLPLSAGLSMPFLAPYSSNNYAALSTSNEKIGPYSASAVPSNYPWSSNKLNNLEGAFSNLSVATSFPRVERSSRSAMPFSSQPGNGTAAFPSLTSDRANVPKSPFTPFPDGATGFFPEVNSNTGRALILNEENGNIPPGSIFPKSVFRATPPGINVNRADLASTVNGSPLTAPFGEDPFGSPFAEPPLSPLFLSSRSLSGSRRGTLRDVWKTSLDNLQESQKSEDQKTNDANTILSPPATPSNNAAKM